MQSSFDGEQSEREKHTYTHTHTSSREWVVGHPTGKYDRRRLLMCAASSARGDITEGSALQGAKRSRSFGIVRLCTQIPPLSTNSQYYIALRAMCVCIQTGKGSLFVLPHPPLLPLVTSGNDLILFTRRTIQLGGVVVVQGGGRAESRFWRSSLMCAGGCWGVLDDGRWGGKKHEVIESYSKHVTCTSTSTHWPSSFLSLSSCFCQKTLAEYPSSAKKRHTTGPPQPESVEEKLPGNSGNINQVNQSSVMDGVGVSYQRQKTGEGGGNHPGHWAKINNSPTQKISLSWNNCVCISIDDVKNRNPSPYFLNNFTR